jgi:hypothetical protein
VSDRWGRSGRNRWMIGMSTGKTLDQATREAFGIGFSELDELWRASLPAREEKKDEPAANPATN